MNPETTRSPATGRDAGSTKPDTEADPRLDARAEHAALHTRFASEATRLEAASQRLSLARLASFIAAIALLATGGSQGSMLWLGAGGLVLLAFAALVARHLRLVTAIRRARVRAEVHERHVKRAGHGWIDLPSPASSAIPKDHDYAFDLDLTGHASLLSRIDTTRTLAGERTLLRWLLAPSDVVSLKARQRAVEELAPRVELRQELEAEARAAGGNEKLDPARFFEFLKRSPALHGKPAMILTIHLLPLTTLTLLVLARVGLVGYGPFAISLGLSALVAVLTSGVASEAFDQVAARRGYVEAFGGALKVAENAEFEAPLNRELQQRLQVDARPASHALSRLDRWAGLSELKTQFPIHFFVNLALLWDLHVLYHLERFAADVGEGLPNALEALGELEALAALATLRHVDPDASMPELVPDGALEAEGLAHPLLAAGQRVANDLRLPGPGSTLLVTGSNMAGKSTLLRALGLDLCLALAGGPVIASRMRVPPLRLRSSMRVTDSLEEGSSYFRAELESMRRVIAEADQAPPIFFLLDELLRGTNEEARHRGARAVVEHLLDHGAFGLVATHDVNLAVLEQERPGKVENRHFTDVVFDGEMRFDYLLRPGVVRSSNALRLLAEIGVSVPGAPEPSEPPEESAHA